MSFLVTLLSVCVLSHCGAFDTSDGHEGMVSERVSKMRDGTIAPLTSLPQNEGRQFLGSYPFPSFTPGYRPQKCPLCDSSAYSYCGEKLLHDACCCAETHQHDLPYQCKLADCRFLHAISCREHRLIANCCCSDDYRAILKIVANT